jgi:hypothetical protein
VAWPLASVVAEPLAGLAWVATDVGTEKRTTTPGTGLPEASLTVAVTQWVVPAVFVALFGASVSVAGWPPERSSSRPAGTSFLDDSRSIPILESPRRAFDGDF